MNGEWILVFFDLFSLGWWIVWVYFKMFIFIFYKIYSKLGLVIKRNSRFLLMFFRGWFFNFMKYGVFLLGLGERMDGLFMVLENISKMWFC